MSQNKNWLTIINQAFKQLDKNKQLSPNPIKSSNFAKAFIEMIDFASSVADSAPEDDEGRIGLSRITAETLVNISEYAPEQLQGLLESSSLTKKQSSAILAAINSYGDNSVNAVLNIIKDPTYNPLLHFKKSVGRDGSEEELSNLVDDLINRHIPSISFEKINLIKSYMKHAMADDFKDAINSKKLEKAIKIISETPEDVNSRTEKQNLDFFNSINDIESLAYKSANKAAVKIKSVNVDDFKNSSVDFFIKSDSKPYNKNKTAPPGHPDYAMLSSDMNGSNTLILGCVTLQDSLNSQHRQAFRYTAACDNSISVNNKFFVDNKIKNFKTVTTMISPVSDRKMLLSAINEYTNNDKKESEKIVNALSLLPIYSEILSHMSVFGEESYERLREKMLFETAISGSYMKVLSVHPAKFEDQRNVSIANLEVLSGFISSLSSKEYKNVSAVSFGFLTDMVKCLNSLKSIDVIGKCQSAEQALKSISESLEVSVYEYNLLGNKVVESIGSPGQSMKNHFINKQKDVIQKNDAVVAAVKNDPSLLKDLSSSNKKAISSNAFPVVLSAFCSSGSCSYENFLNHSQDKIESLISENKIISPRSSPQVIKILSCCAKIISVETSKGFGARDHLLINQASDILSLVAKNEVIFQPAFDKLAQLKKKSEQDNDLNLFIRGSDRMLSVETTKVYLDDFLSKNNNNKKMSK